MGSMDEQSHGTQIASAISVDVTAFDLNLTSSEATVQKALDKLDDMTVTSTSLSVLPSSFVFCDDVIFGSTVPIWHELEKQSDGGTVGTHTATTTSYTELDRYVSAPLGTTEIPEGLWDFTLFAKVSSQSGQLSAQVYRVNSSGVIVGSVLGTAESAVFTNTAVVGIDLSVFIANQTGWAVTDRVGIVLSGKKVGAPAATVTFYHDLASGYLSGVTTPISLLHNQMAGLNLGDYIHLTAAEYAALGGTSLPPESFTPQGRLEVWPGYCELTNDLAVQLNATTDMAQFQWIQPTHYYGPLPPFSWYCDAVGTAGDVTWTLYAVSDAGVLSSLDSVTTAISSTGWKRETGFDANVHLVAGRSYALVVSVSASDDISLSCNRNNTSTTSSLPDGVTCYLTTDGGTNWTACLKDTCTNTAGNPVAGSGRPAVLNVQLNTTSAHQPYLHYGRYTGKYVPCLNAAGTEWFLGEIPADGLNLDVSGLTVDTMTWLFLKEDLTTAGTLALEASQSVTTWTEVAGRTHAGDNGEKMLIGACAPTTLGSALAGPKDVMQERLLSNVFNVQNRIIGKRNPYVGTTSDTPANSFEAWAAAGDGSSVWTCRWIQAMSVWVHFQIVAGWSGGSSGSDMSIAIDSLTVPSIDSTAVRLWNGSYAPHRSTFVGRISPGKHYAVPLQVMTSGMTINFFAIDASATTVRAEFKGSIQC